MNEELERLRLAIERKNKLLRELANLFSTGNLAARSPHVQAQAYMLIGMIDREKQLTE